MASRFDQLETVPDEVENDPEPADTKTGRRRINVKITVQTDVGRLDYGGRDWEDGHAIEATLYEANSRAIKAYVGNMVASLFGIDNDPLAAVKADIEQKILNIIADEQRIAEEEAKAKAQGTAGTETVTATLDETGPRDRAAATSLGETTEDRAARHADLHRTS